MPKKAIDYSNTIFYMISCKDKSISDVYIGHTTNFVQRKHAHKRACINQRSPNHNYKVYKVIREHQGWENWNMEIIGFNKCEDHNEARKKEQEYYEKYEASLNSILPQKKIVNRLPIVVKEKINLYCDECKIKCGSRKQLEKHKNSRKHLTNIKEQKDNEKVPKKCDKFVCQICDYSTCRKSQYERHLNTVKHKMITNGDRIVQAESDSFVCTCGKKFKYRQGLSRHRKKCKSITKTHIEADKNNENLIEMIIRQQESHKTESEELKMMILKQQELLKKQQEELDKQIQELMPKNADNKASKPKVK